MADFEKEIDASFRRVHVGDMVTGTVVSVSDDQVLVDLGTYVGGSINKENLSKNSCGPGL